MSDLNWLFNANVIAFLARGLRTTFLVTSICASLAFTLGVMLALARMSACRWLRYPAVIWTELLRSVPLLLIVYFVFFGINASLERLCCITPIGVISRVTL